jgi:8-oxo-dGTP diphosphatase
MGETRPEPPRPSQRVAVYGIYESPDHQVLLVRAAPYLTVAGQWFLPGGGLEHGEDPVAGLRREFAEETGLDVRVGDLLGILSDLYTLPDGVELHTIRIIYAIESHSGTLRHEVDGSSDTARWVPLEEAWSLPLRPYVLQALTDLR